MRRIKFGSILLLMCFCAFACSSNDDENTTPSTSGGNEDVRLSGSAAPSSFSTKILVEDYTGTWCGNCPRLAHALEESIKKNSKVIGVGVHCESGDPFTFTHSASMVSKFPVNGYPTGLINRDFVWNETFAHLGSFLSKTVPLGIGLKTSLDKDIVRGTIKIGFSKDLDESLSYVIYLVEDKLVAPQANYFNDDASSPFYKKGEPISNFEHASVLRKAATDIYGENIPEKFTKKGKVCEADFELKLGNYKKENCYIVAFVVKKGGKEVFNVQKVKAGATQDFD
ncbi:MAG: Omp28-related outer membrane protein [Marinifilaceae bacterium]